MIDSEARGRSEHGSSQAVPDTDGGRVSGVPSPEKMTSDQGGPYRIKHLLVAERPDLIGSGALATGIAFADRAGAKVSAVSVVEPPGSSEPFPPEVTRGPEGSGSQLTRARTALVQEFERHGFKPKLVQVTSGDPAIQVEAFAEESDPDLLMVGSRVSHGFESIKAGSAGERIVKHSKRPVMVATRGGSSRFKRIVIAVDLSRHSQVILQWACRLAWVDSSEVRVVHSERLWSRFWRWLSFRSSGTFQTRAWQRFMVRFWELQFPGESQIFLRRGHAGRAILREARSWNADLVVMGMRRFGWTSRCRLGRTTRYIIRYGGRSTVVVPSRGSGEVPPSPALS